MALPPLQVLECSQADCVKGALLEEKCVTVCGAPMMLEAVMSKDLTHPNVVQTYSYAMKEVRPGMPQLASSYKVASIADPCSDQYH